MRAGRLRHRVAIQAASQVQDAASGYTSDSWSTVATVSANIEPLNGRERFEAAQVSPDVTHEITMRWNPEVALGPGHRLVGQTNPYADVEFNVESVLNVAGRSREWLVLAVENK